MRSLEAKNQLQRTGNFFSMLGTAAVSSGGLTQAQSRGYWEFAAPLPTYTLSFFLHIHMYVTADFRAL